MDNLSLSAGFDLATDKRLVNSGPSLNSTSKKKECRHSCCGDFGQVAVGKRSDPERNGRGITGGANLVLRETRHVPELTKNLISASQNLTRKVL